MSRGPEVPSGPRLIHVLSLPEEVPADWNSKNQAASFRHHSAGEGEDVEEVRSRLLPTPLCPTLYLVLYLIRFTRFS